MNSKLRDRLDALRLDFAANEPSERPFRYFHCPILGVDEDVELQRGHVVNEAFADSDRVWVPQRKDVDNFYGSHFEAEFEQIQYKHEGLAIANVLADRELSRKLRPGFFLEGQRVEHIRPPDSLPPGLTLITVVTPDHPPLPLALKMPPEAVVASAGRSWEIGFERDLRLPALVSLLKAAHLSAFHLLGYRYALGTAGLFIGPDVLGKFFRDANGRSRAEIRGRAMEHFGEFEHAVRPVHGFLGPHPHGTIRDRILYICRGSSGSLWGLVVFIRTAHLMQAVLLPNGSDPETIATYLEFLRNDNETIHISTGRFDASGRRFEVLPNSIPMRWPKAGPQLR